MQRERNSNSHRPIEMSVTYRFKSSIEDSTVFFFGKYISVGDLRKEITKQKKLAVNTDYELQIMNAETKHVYEFDPTLIPADTCLIVSRIPVPVQLEPNSQTPSPPSVPDKVTVFPTLFPSTATATTTDYSYTDYSDTYQSTYYSPAVESQYNYNQYYAQNPNYNDYYSNNSYACYDTSRNYDYPEQEYRQSQDSYATAPINIVTAKSVKSCPNPNLRSVPTDKPNRVTPYSYSYPRRTSESASENSVDEKSTSKDVKNEEAEKDNLFASNSAKGRYQYQHLRSDPPLSYRCFKCNIAGHWIAHCPLLLSQPHNVKRSTGIPRSQMIIVDGPEVEGAYITPEGRYAIPSTHPNLKKMSDGAIEKFGP